MSPVPRLRAYSGPAILSYVFRPFFFAAAAYAGFGILIWLPLFFCDRLRPRLVAAACGVALTDQAPGRQKSKSQPWSACSTWSS